MFMTVVGAADPMYSLKNSFKELKKKFQHVTIRGLTARMSEICNVILHEMELKCIFGNRRARNIPEKLNDNVFEVYTDGSKVVGGVGFFVCILKYEIQQNILSYKLNTDNTVFQAELVALGEASAWAVETNNKINIISDSRSSIDGLKGHRTKFKFVNGIKEKFRLAEGLVRLTSGSQAMRFPIASQTSKH
ncbi:hypothetical protein AVEN_175602-1 [Araneus ventricosus]|uniref:RNase H type-1 domain-containing protein n=1 Tax=Araneus ventricosus TaxID=182803 RepID=A0A4Y2G1B7_ARAVE|nr:hypothetical protein AVEN_175602-1 [Araneus ventricosus]